MPIPDCLYRYRDELEAELRATVADEPSPLHDMMRYHLGWVDDKGQNLPSSGKLSRPTLCLLSCEAVGGDWRAALPGATAIELVHNFSLIHDDIQDKSWERRNRPTVWKVWGEAQAINAGDAMYATAQLAVLRLDDTGIPPEKVLLLSRQLNLASVQLCQGQYLDLEYERHLDIGADRYLDMIGRKTACLFETSLFFGALLGTDDQAQVLSLCSFGRNLGMAFQMHNDVLGIWGEGESSKESPYTDIGNRKKTIPVIYALQEAEDKDKARLVDIYSRTDISPEDIAQVLDILERTNAREHAEQMRVQYHLQGLKDLAAARLPRSFEQELGEMAAFLLGEG